MNEAPIAVAGESTPGKYGGASGVLARIRLELGFLLSIADS
jgi:hypothetical protein